MKALTIWQPWASLIMAGAKPYEFRRWDYSDRYPSLIGRRVVIHAGARPVMRNEIEDLLERMDDHISSVDYKIARPMLQRLLAAHKCRGLPLAAGLGTAALMAPKSVTSLFSSPADSDRIDHHMWAWPLKEITPFSEPVPMRGMQGFWNWPLKEAA